jgi:hypothetical protein
MKRKAALTPLILRRLVSNALSVMPLLVPALLVPTLLVSTLRAQQAAASTETPSSPFSIKNTWIVGGTGSWDYLTMAPLRNGFTLPMAVRCRWWM